MECCGRELEPRAGGGFVCRCCQAEYGVPVGESRNAAARSVVSGGGLESVPNAVPAAPAKVIFRGLDYGVGQGPPEPIKQEFEPVFPVEQPKVSGFGRGGRKGGPK